MEIIASRGTAGGGHHGALTLSLRPDYALGALISDKINQRTLLVGGLPHSLLAPRARWSGSVALTC